MTELELLAPAKNLETGIAAITHGADAVYIAADKFGAREKAGNSLTDIETLVRFAHQFNARIYVTVNTILFDNELTQVEELISNLYKINVDAIIVQDLSILGMKIPPIAIHASTQMHNVSVERIRLLESYGVNRIVLPREFSLTQIAEFKKQITSEIEFFIHGALCVCYSGQCYMSQAITGRSANRGACAQPCRSSYNLIDENGTCLAKNRYLLSLKDLNLSNHIGQLIEAGVTSFKIEGRLKDIQYVKNVTAFYNNLINEYIGSTHNYRRQSSGSCIYKFIPDIERSFNRGFTSYFIEGRQHNNSSMFTQKSIGKPLGLVGNTYGNKIDINTTEEIHNGDGLCYFDKNELKGFLVNNANKQTIEVEQDIPCVGTTIYRNADHNFDRLLGTTSSQRKISTQISMVQHSNQLQFSITDEDGNCANININNTFKPAIDTELALKNIRSQMSKTGNTIFLVSNVGINNYHKVVFIPISELNTIRRNLIQKLLQTRTSNYIVIQRKLNSAPIKLTPQEANYKWNISNLQSKQIVEDAGIKVIEPAFEQQEPQPPIELMVTRYCIRYELNMCPNKQNAEPPKQLFLKDNNHKYKLVFDCKNCQMKVILNK